MFDAMVRQAHLQLVVSTTNGRQAHHERVVSTKNGWYISPRTGGKRQERLVKLNANRS